MEVIGRVGLKNSGKVFGVQRTEHWKTKLSKGNELVRGVNGVKRKEERQEKLSKVVKQKTEPVERKDLFQRPTAVKTVNSPLTNDVNTAFRTILEHLKKAMSVCSLKAKLSFKDYAVSVNKPCEFVELVKCCLVLDAEKRQVKFKIHKGVAISAINACIPPPVKKAKSVIRTAIKRIPLQNQTAITKLFSAIFKVLATKQDRDYVTMSQDDVIDNDMSFEQLMSSNKLYSTLLALDLKILCSKSVVVELKRRQILAGIRRGRVVLDASQGLQIFKEPRVFMRSEEVQVALVTLAKWVSSHQQFGVLQNVLEVVKCLQAVTNYRGKYGRSFLECNL